MRLFSFLGFRPAVITVFPERLLVAQPFFFQLFQGLLLIEGKVFALLKHFQNRKGEGVLPEVFPIGLEFFIVVRPHVQNVFHTVQSLQVRGFADETLLVFRVLYFVDASFDQHLFKLSPQFFFVCHVASNSLSNFTQKHTQILMFRQLPLFKDGDRNGQELDGEIQYINKPLIS